MTITNVATATTELEISRFIVTTGKDSFGTYHILTGYEGTGRCFWCGKGLDGKRKRYCKSGPRYVKEETAHWRQYYQHFDWTFAKNWCLERYDNRCANCGQGWQELYDKYTALKGKSTFFVEATLEVHHIIPLEGEDRQWTPYNLPWNLICLCHGCHQAIHLILRPSRKEPASASQRMAKGQLPLEGILSSSPW